LVVGRGEVLGVVIGMVTVAFVPAVFELLLGFAILEPAVSHVHSFGATLLDGAVGDANCSAVVTTTVGGRLGMAHFVESDAHVDGVLAVAERATCFGFSGGSNDNFEDGAVGSHGAIIGWFGVGSKRVSVGVGWLTAEEPQR
jgi:hypothetical protein